MPCNVDIPPPAITHGTAFLLTTTPRLPAISMCMSWDMVIASFAMTIPVNKSTPTIILQPRKVTKEIHPVMKGKIVKPKGSITREYRWEDVGLEEEKLENIKQFVKYLVVKYLDTRMSWVKNKSKRKAAIEKIQKKVLDSFPILGQYINCWPVLDVIKTYLKYTSETFRKCPSASGNAAPSGAGPSDSGASLSDDNASGASVGSESMPSSKKSLQGRIIEERKEKYGQFSSQSFVHSQGAIQSET
ncbi:hypothetical protein ARMSODRAFT_982029 [Armillaria solidipes]|uniref:Uncharacterized protein n=1 Tax=Armillaria solidipes TaxID=1076256 RepID=A0A2H3AT86_9AGAR|nr:hypothetical protein ARMSODRAFT_982029 [Armillaria solidipes]